MNQKLNNKLTLIIKKNFFEFFRIGSKAVVRNNY